MNLEDLEIFKIAMALGEDVSLQVEKWNDFHKDTLGKQFVRAADSIAANIGEGFGRYHYKESKHFLYYSRGSLFEAKVWLQKALYRGLIAESEAQRMDAQLKTLSVKLNNYIRSIGNTNYASEPEAEYDSIFQSFN